MLAEVLKIILPALLVFLAGYLALSKLLTEEAKRRKTEQMVSSRKISIPIRLQAYERIILFLERISPDSLLVRVSHPNMNSQKLQAALLSSIRHEWEHNLSQQLYISSEGWEVVKSAKDNVIKLINTASVMVEGKLPGLKLSQVILENLMETETHPTAKAIEFLKKEVNEIF